MNNKKREKDEEIRLAMLSEDKKKSRLRRQRLLSSHDKPDGAGFRVEGRGKHISSSERGAIG